MNLIGPWRIAIWNKIYTLCKSIYKILLLKFLGVFFFLAIKDCVLRTISLVGCCVDIMLEISLYGGVFSMWCVLSIDR